MPTTPDPATILQANPALLVQQLNTALGAASVAALAGAKDSKASYRWARAGGPVPRDAALRRLLFAHQQWSRIEDAVGADAARTWFIAANPHLGFDTPIAAIRREQFRRTAMAADELAGS